MTGWLYRLPDHFIPVSYWISKGIGQVGIPEEKRTVVYDGIALHRRMVEIGTIMAISDIGLFFFIYSEPEYLRFPPKDKQRPEKTKTCAC